ncbi:MAG: hypothetical protein AAFY41_14860 [Bacteroidota bacterium]
MKDIADMLQVDSYSLWLIERGELHRVTKSVFLSIYLRYFEFLKLDVTQTYEKAIQNMKHSITISVNSEYEIREQIYYNQVVEAATELQDRGITPTPNLVAMEVGMTSVGLRYYDSIQEFFTEISQNIRKIQRYQFVKELNHALTKLINNGVSPIQAVLANEVNLDGSALRQRARRDKSGQIRKILDSAKAYVKYFENIDHQKRQVEKQYDVIIAAQDIQSEGATPTKVAIAEYLDTSVEALEYYDGVKRLLADIVQSNMKGETIDAENLLFRFVTEPSETDKIT